MSSNVYEDVASSLKYDIDELISQYEENLAVKMSEEVRGYDPSYAEQPHGPAVAKYGKLRENAILDLVEAMLTVLFANEQ